MNAFRLQEIANSQRNGYLKPWKARSMLATLTAIPEIASDRVRLRKWVAGCLEMEGFTNAGIEVVTDALLASLQPSS